MPPKKKIPANRLGSKGNIFHPSCPYCGFIHCWKHGKYWRKWFYRAGSDAPWGSEKEVIAELSAAALMYMLGKEPPLGNNFQYIKGHAEEMSKKPGCFAPGSFKTFDYISHI